MSLNPDPPVPKRNQNNQHRVRRWLPYLGGTLLLGLILAGLWPRPEPVETAPVEVGPLRATVNEEGKTRIKQRYVVSAPVAGQLRRVPFKVGAPVVAGATVVAVIDPLSPALLDARTRSLAEARRDSAAAALEKARAAETYASSELRRFEQLYREKTATAQELEGAQWRQAAATRDRAAADSGLRQAEAEMAEFNSVNEGSTNHWRTPVEVKAPATGQVLRVFEENARVVSAGTSLLEVGDPTDLEVVIEVLSRDGAGISPGTKVELDQWGGDRPLEARVRLVEPSAFTKVSALGVEEQRVRVIADFATSPAQRRSLGDNFRVEAHIITWETNQVVKVPAGVLFRRSQQWATFVVADGRARVRAVRVGGTSGTETQILDGLRPGEEAILYPGDRVRDGQRVRKIKI